MPTLKLEANLAETEPPLPTPAVSNVCQSHVLGWSPSTQKTRGGCSDPQLPRWDVHLESRFTLLAHPKSLCIHGALPSGGATDVSIKIDDGDSQVSSALLRAAREADGGVAVVVDPGARGDFAIGATYRKCLDWPGPLLPAVVLKVEGEEVTTLSDVILGGEPEPEPEHDLHPHSGSEPPPRPRGSIVGSQTVVHCIGGGQLRSCFNLGLTIGARCSCGAWRIELGDLSTKWKLSGHLTLDGRRLLRDPKIVDETYLAVEHGGAADHLDEGFHRVVFTIEQAYKDASAVSLPWARFEGSDREAGSTCVVPSGPVEVTLRQGVAQGGGSRSLHRVDPSEVDQAGSVLAWKWLHPEVHLVVEATRHADVGGLVAALDWVKHTVTMNTEGKGLWSLQGVLQSSGEQYLRIGLPEDTTVWGATVAGAAVKPARDQTTDGGFTMLPLGARRGQLTIELTYLLENLTDQQPLRLPVFTIQVNRVGLVVRTPKEVKEWDLGGGLRQVDALDASTGTWTLPHTGLLGGRTSRRAIIATMSSESRCSLMSDAIESDASINFCDPTEPPPPVPADDTAGVIPVKVAPVEQGEAAYFTTILISPNTRTLSVTPKGTVDTAACCIVL